MGSKKDTIKVLLVVGTMDRGGVETMLMNILRYIDRARFELIFLCFQEREYDFEEELISLGSRIIRIPDVKKVGVFRHLSDLMGIVKNEQIDIIHAHTYFNSMFSILAGALSGVGVRVTHSHNTKSEEGMSLAKSLYSIVAKWIINNVSTAYFACGNDAGRAMYYKSKKITVINNGIPLEDFRYDEAARRRLRMKMGIGESETVLMNVGRFELQKNHTFLIDIFAEYLALNDSAKLLLIGDGSLFQEINAKVKKIGIENNVVFLGKRTDVGGLYNVADMLLLPSLHEGLPVTMVEAQANGLVCVVSDEVDKEAGFTDCVSFLPLAAPAKEWARFMEKQSGERIDTSSMQGGQYDIKSQVERIEDLYSTLLIRSGVK